MKKSRGIIRNKTQIFLLCKEAKRKKTSRFAKQSLSGGEEIASNSTNVSNQSSNIRNPLIEMSTIPIMSTIPPQWVDKYEDCLSMIKEIDDIKKKILTEQSRRLSAIKISDQKDSERKIYSLSTQATLRIKKSERLIEQIRLEGRNCKSDSDQKTINNLCMGLMITIQQKTKQLRGQQRAFIQQRQHIQNSTKVSFLQLAAQKTYDTTYMDDEYETEEMELEMRIQQERNQQILKIVQSIHELNDVYKELNNLVIMQGSLLDRIDFNIIESQTFVKKAAQTLERTDERQKKSKCACRVISLMVIAMIILAVILIVRWTR